MQWVYCPDVARVAGPMVTETRGSEHLKPSVEEVVSMWTPTTAWLGTLAAGLIVSFGLRALAGARSRSPWWAVAVVGLVGAALGRVLLRFSFLGWHPAFCGGVVGALVLSAIWLAVMRSRRAPEQSPA